MRTNPKPKRRVSCVGVLFLFFHSKYILLDHSILDTLHPMQRIKVYNGTTVALRRNNMNANSVSFVCAPCSVYIAHLISDCTKMDRFVIKKRKNDENSSSNSNIENNNSQPSTSVESKLKHKSIKRKFNAEWENLFFVTESNDKSICLVCRKEFADNKKYTIERHFSNSHSEINTKFLSSEKRATEITRLKNDLKTQQKVVRSFLDKNELLTCASYQIAFNIAKSGKSYSDGEFHKNLLCSTVATLCENVDDKFKAPLLDKIKLLPLSDKTIGRRVKDLGMEIETKLKNNLQECHSFALALDESTDIADTSQLVFWVRFIIDMNNIQEDILALVPLNERTCGIDILNAFKIVHERFNLNLSKLVCVCTDGAPAMVGKNIGFVALLKKYLVENDSKQDVIAYHCILHQENLCAEAIQGECDVLDTVKQVHILNNFLHSISNCM